MGDHEEITWKDKHGDHYHDYRAHPKYKFSYGVVDHHTKDHHDQSEHRDGTYILLVGIYRLVKYIDCRNFYHLFYLFIFFF